MKKLLIGLGALLLVVLAGGALVSGLAGSGSDSAGLAADDKSVAGTETAPNAVVRDRQALQDEAATSADTSASDAPEARQPAIIRRGVIGLRSDRAERDLQLVRQLAARLRGSVSSEESSSNDGKAWVSITLRVPNESFDTAMSQLADIGEVEHREVSSEDVTTQVIDVDARVRAQRASVSSLERLMARAKTVGEVMSVERELARRQGELDGLVQQQRYLADQTSLATIAVTLSEDEDSTSDEDGSGFVHGVRSGWHALGVLADGTATFVGMVLPFVPVVLVAAGVVAWVARRRRRRARPAA